MAGHKFDFGDSQKIQVFSLFKNITSERVEILNEQKCRKTNKFGEYTLIVLIQYIK